MKYTNDSLIDLLVVVLIGAIGGFIAFLGSHLDITIIYLVGIVILISLVLVTASTMIRSILRFIRTILDFKDHFRNQHP